MGEGLTFEAFQVQLDEHVEALEDLDEVIRKYKYIPAAQKARSRQAYRKIRVKEKVRYRQRKKKAGFKRYKKIQKIKARSGKTARGKRLVRRS